MNYNKIICVDGGSAHKDGVNNTAGFAWVVANGDGKIERIRYAALGRVPQRFLRHSSLIAEILAVGVPLRFVTPKEGLSFLFLSDHRGLVAAINHAALNFRQPAKPYCKDLRAIKAEYSSCDIKSGCALTICFLVFHLG